LYPSYEQFIGKVSDAETRTAKAFIHVNLDTANNMRELVKNEMPSVIISPAITIVLFQLLGVNPTIFSSWRGQESLAALHAFRELTFFVVRKILGEENPDYDKFNQLRLRRLEFSVPHPNQNKKVIEFPKFGPYTGWINGDMAPFADVSALYCLIQCKHTISPDKTISINLYDE
jgi:hypothetical protein